MKIFLLSFILLYISFTSTLLKAQYSPTSPYLQNPILAIGYTDSCAQFWLQTWDEQIGGFFTNIDKFGNVITNWGTNKNMLTQSRNAYGLTRAYMLTGDTTYITFAGEALSWMYAHAWDTTYDGWFQEIDINGNPMFPSNNKTAFYQHYALLGIAAYYEATGDTTAWNWLIKGYQHLENIYWDTRSQFLGYYDKANYNNQNTWDKSFNATVDAITTHLLYLYLMNEDLVYRLRLEELATEIINYMIASMPQQAIGFVERYNSDWNWDNGETMTIMGHVLKAGWCLARINQLFPDTSYINSAEVLITDVWDNGYDHEYGGPYKDFNRITGEMLLWGLQDSAKAWWQMEQAIVAGLQMYDITKKSWYLQMADETINFFMNYFVDHENGEIYFDRTRYGGFAWHEEKGNSGKAGYHSIETGYYTYLYGSLFFTYEPVTLHYYYEPLDYNREFLLSPIAINKSNLIITQILQDGQAYANFDPYERILNLPPSEGGHFEVTYEPVITNVASGYNTSPNDFELFQNYPNPFNPVTTIQYQIPDLPAGRQGLSFTTLKVFDLLGREISTLVSEEKSSGNYEVKFDASSLPSGIYFYNLRVGKFSETKKMIMMK
jgi:mannose/cellobiose epimerase-like protein (N-acyl-D-glucosamine 2-epimerase family)